MLEDAGPPRILACLALLDEPTPTMILDRCDHVCVIGAGTSGLAMVKSLLDAGRLVDCLEQEADLGGNWNSPLACSSVYESTHLISSKLLTQYNDYPMPESWPEFPGQRLVLQYVRGYAQEFGLTDHIEFGCGVQRAEPMADGEGWLVTLTSGEQRHYGRLAIANGHVWDPLWPEYKGTFGGQTLHSAEYKRPDVLAEKRVLVVGGGNSGCDIAVESALHAGQTRLSLRRGYHFLPKFFHGTPIDICGERLLRWRFPLWLRRMFALVVNFFMLGTRLGTGLPKPTHRLYESHPIINSQLIYALRHGDLEIRPDIERLNGDTVCFTDGTEEPFDVIVYATGYKLSFPFIDVKHLNWQGDIDRGRPELYLNVFHPERDDLFVLGMIQPDSGQWCLVESQAKLVAKYLTLCDTNPGALDSFRDRKRHPVQKKSIRYLDTPRHRIEVEHFSYHRALRRELRGFV